MFVNRKNYIYLYFSTCILLLLHFEHEKSIFAFCKKVRYDVTNTEMLRLEGSIMLLSKIKGTALGRTLANSRLNKCRKKNKEKMLLKQKAMKHAMEWYPNLSGSELSKRVKDMLYCYDRYRMRFSDYTAFHIESVPEEERGTFITDITRSQYYSRLNRPENEDLFKKKNLTYLRFRDYYKRDFCAFTDPDQQDVFYQFLEKHKRIIIKPLRGSLGKRIQVIEQAVYPELLASYKNGFAAEELIRQSAEMAVLNPESVNTVRMTTIHCDDHVEFLMPMLKCGRKGKCVDNAGSGGVLCEVDLETGRVVRAASKKGEPMTHHPDSGLPLIGFQVPRWKEALEFAKQLCYVVPENRYTGWDIALTDEGWVMIEGNSRGEFGMQILSHKGMKPQMDAILEQIEHPTSK